MNNNTILNWDDADYKTIYNRQLIEHPLYWDETLNTWVIYSYDFCKTILLSEHAHVPQPAIETNTLLNERAALLLSKLVRISNNEQHPEARQAAMAIYKSMKPVSISHIIESLLTDVKRNEEFDWIAVVCKKLPAMIISKSLGFPDSDSEYITKHISSLVKIMSPAKTATDIALINKVVDEFYVLSEKHISSAGFSDLISKSEVGVGNGQLSELLVCNLIGLFIQCYDAGRGLLCNTLLNLFRPYDDHKLQQHDISRFKELVIETLRLDPPVHNTRRIAVKDISIGGQLIKAGQSILVVIAAANIDPQVFKDPELYDPSRGNNDQHLTFGLGAHNCFAKYMMIDMAAETCSYLTKTYKHITLLQQEFKYEAQLNVRLGKELMIRLS